MIRAANAASCADGNAVFTVASGIYEKKVHALKSESDNTGSKLSNMIAFVREAYDGGNEPVILAARLTSDPWSSRFIGTFGSSDYETLSKDMELSERGNDLKQEILKLDL
jgi:hypothetical protein